MWKHYLKCSVLIFSSWHDWQLALPSLSAHSPPLAYSMTKYSVLSVSITSNNFTGGEREMITTSIKTSKHARDYSHQIWILKEHISLTSFTLTLWSIKQQVIMFITRGKWHFIGWSFFFCYVLLDNPPQNRIGPKYCISRVLWLWCIL